jgi:hypothetical protein
MNEQQAAALAAWWSAFTPLQQADWKRAVAARSPEDWMVVSIADADAGVTSFWWWVADPDAGPGAPLTMSPDAVEWIEAQEIAGS